MNMAFPIWISIILSPNLEMDMRIVRIDFFLYKYLNMEIELKIENVEIALKITSKNISKSIL